MATAASWRRTSRRAAWRPISTARPGWASRPQTSPGTATPWCSRTATCSPSRAASRTSRSSPWRISTWAACSPTACGRTPSPTRPAATPSRTRNQAWQLMRAVGAEAEEIDIRPSCMQMLKDLRHPYAKGRKVYDVTFENVQAGERTSHLFRLANLHRGLVVGTGDLSELSLGWATYGVGDHMSHYNVNASVPKTLIQYLIGWVAESGEVSADVKRALHRVLDTEISPELVPGKQTTEDTVGPYELQDFNLYYTLRFGYSPAKVAFLAWHAWKGKYRLPAIRKWLGVFLSRFFRNQFKRSVAANAPKVGSGGSLSPRGDWRAPSDGNASAWLADLAKVPAKEG